MNINQGAMSVTIPGRNPHGDGRYMPIIDGWRAVAIVLVLLFHGLFNSKLEGHPYLQTLGILTQRTGALGVLIFFCISGYLITQRLLVESLVTGTFSLRSFYIKRAFRILPPLCAYLTVAVFLFLCGVIKLVPRDLSAPLFLANYFQGSWYTSHFWSLSVEEHFYLFWPICAVLLGWRRSMWVGVTLIVLVAVWRPWELNHVTEYATTLQHTDMRLDYIMMGAVVALMTAVYPRTIILFKRLGTVSGLLLLFVLLVLTTLHSPIDLRSFQSVLLTLIVCASTISDRRLVRRLLTSPPVLFVGKVSYSLYVWQQFFLGPNQSLFWSSPTALPLKFAAALTVAWCSFRFIEQPFIRYGRSLLVTQAANQSTTIVEG